MSYFSGALVGDTRGTGGPLGNVNILTGKVIPRATTSVGAGAGARASAAPFKLQRSTSSPSPSSLIPPQLSGVLPKGMTESLGNLNWDENSWMGVGILAGVVLLIVILL